MAERAYMRDRRVLRGLPPIPPPRDLWARTSAALDREIARHPGQRRQARTDRPLRRADSPALLLSALASLALAITVVGTQLSPSSGAPEGPGAPAAALPTPFDVPTQALAFVELTAEGLAIYQTTVDRACPPVAIDCAEVSTAHRQVIAAPGEITAVSLDLHEANGRLALLTIDALGNDSVSVLILPEVTEPIPMVTPPGDIGPDVPFPPSVPSPGTGSARTLPPSPDPGGATATPEGTPEPSGPAPGEASGVQPSVPGVDPSESAASPTAPGDGTTDPGPATPSPDVSSPSVTPPTSLDPSLALPSSSPVPAAMQAVLEDVRVVGSRPTWSSDGDMLAFSAMPADASRGPDVYLWRIGETQAQRLTDDGMSYFASWSGRRVVVSRAQETGPTDDGVATSTVVIDPVTGVERAVTGDGGWLPAIDPSGRFAISWQGELAADGRAVRPVNGALAMLDWRAMDPFTAASPTGTDRPAGQLDGSLVTGAPDTGAGATDGVPEETEERTPRTRPSSEERAERREEKRANRREASPAPEVSPIASETGTTPSPAPFLEPRSDLGPVEPGRDPEMDPVREWQVRWSQDSSAFGFWVTETPGAAWGQLAVLRVEPATSSIDHRTVLLASTLARRSFTLGRDRVAWVAPSEDRPDGELRLRTWGPRGHGSLRIREFDVRTGLPAF
jgi:hypothetical protein